jgi:hypothetical protein
MRVYQCETLFLKTGLVCGLQLVGLANAVLLGSVSSRSHDFVLMFHIQDSYNVEGPATACISPRERLAFVYFRPLSPNDSNYFYAISKHLVRIKAHFLITLCCLCVSVHLHLCTRSFARQRLSEHIPSVTMNCWTHNFPCSPCRIKGQRAISFPSRPRCLIVYFMAFPIIKLQKLHYRLWIFSCDVFTSGCGATLCVHRTTGTVTLIVAYLSSRQRCSHPIQHSFQQWGKVISYTDHRHATPQCFVW